MKTFLVGFLFICVAFAQTESDPIRDGEKDGELEKGCTDRESSLTCAALYLTRTDKPTVCGSEEKPTCVEITKGEKSVECPSCLPASSVGDVLDTSCKTLKETPECRDGEVPTIARTEAGLCPSCKKSFEVDTCDLVKLAECKRTLEAATVCTDKADFTLDKDSCCMSCKPPSFDCGEKVCATSARDLTACPEMEISRVVEGSCCRSCIPKKVLDMKAASDGKEWTREEFKDAIREIPECEFREKAEKDSRLPVPTCKRPQSKRTLEDVVKCVRSKEVCETFQEFKDILPGQACPACRPPKPTCSPVCEDDEICVPFAHNGRVNFTRGTKCVGKRKFKLRLKARRRMAALRDKMKEMEKEEFVELLREVVSRFCERTDDKVKRICDKRLELILASLKCKAVKKRGQGEDAEVEVEIEVSGDETGDVETTESRRLLAEDDTETFIKDAVNDSEEVEEAGDGDMGSPATKLVAGVGITFVSLVGLMLA